MIEEKKTTLLDYTISDSARFFNDYVVGLDFSDEQYNFLRENKEAVLLRAKAAYHLSALMSEQDCVEAACNAVLKFVPVLPENESLAALFNKWIVNGGYRLLGLGDTALARGEFPCFQSIQAENKAIFAEWLANYYRMVLKTKASGKMNTHTDFADHKNAGSKPDLEIQSLDSMFNKWLVEYLSKSDPSNEHNEPSVLPTYQALNDNDKAAFGEWLLEHYRAKLDKKEKEESARIKARTVLQELRFSRIGDQQIPYSVATELADRVAVYIDSCTDSKDAVLLVLRDWFNNEISDPDVNSWIRNWMYNRLVELKSEEK